MKQIGIKQVKLYSAEYKCEERYNYVKESRKGMEKGRDDDTILKAKVVNDLDDTFICKIWDIKDARRKIINKLNIV